MTTIWNGTTSSDALQKKAADARAQIADASKAYDWPRVLKLLAYDRDLINTCRLNGKALFTPLHQAAHGGAPIEIVCRLIDLGAWRTLRNARGERPVDVAMRKGHSHLHEILDPVLKHRVPIGVLLKIQYYFHRVIHERIDRIVLDHNLRFPELEPLLEMDEPRIWFPVPGMHGGFSYCLKSTGDDAILISKSWCRVAEGSGQRHEITSEGSRLVGEGFV